MQLQSQIEKFREAGLGVAVISYDTPALQQAFVDKAGIEFPLLSDVDAQSMTALGILNTEYQPGDSAYGIPYPGALVLDPSETIQAKLFVEGYEIRVKAENVLAVAQAALGIGSEGAR